MSRFLLTIKSPADRAKAARWAMAAPLEMRIEFKETKRTVPQSDRMWAMLTDIATQLAWHGKKMPTDSWKLMFLDALKRSTNEALDIVPNIDGTGFVNLSTSSSDLSIEEMTDMIEIMFKFGTEHDVVFHEPKKKAAA